MFRDVYRGGGESEKRRNDESIIGERSSSEMKLCLIPDVRETNSVCC